MDWGQVPFPNDLSLDDAGHLKLTRLPSGPNSSTDFEALLLDSLDDLDGAGTWTNVYFPIEGDLDAQSLAGNAVLVDLATGDSISADLLWRADLAAVVIAPKAGVVLEEQHSYGAYLTSGVESADGAPLRRSEAFAAMLATTPPTDPALAAARTSLQPLLDLLGADASSIVSATVFRTATISRDMIALHDANAAAPPVVTVTRVITDPTEIYGVQPSPAPPGLSSKGGRAQPSTHVAAVVHGTIALPNYWTSDPHEPGLLQLDSGGVPVLQSTDVVAFTLHLPVAANYDDLPVITYQHGIGTSRGRSVTIADTAAAHGIATIAIDLPYHGSRAIGAVDTINNATGAAVADGFGDEDSFSTVQFFHLLPGGPMPSYHPAAMRENLRRGASDFDALIAFVHGGNVGPLNTALAAATLPPVTFRADKIGAMATSLGAIVSIPIAAVNPDIAAAVFTVPAAGFPYPSLLYSYAFGETFASVVYDTTDVGSQIELTSADKDPRFHPIVVLWNYAVSPGDSLSFAPHLLDGAWRDDTNVHVFMAEAHSDEWVPNLATASLAKAVGLQRMTVTADATLPTPVLPQGIQLTTVPAPVSGNIGGSQTAAIMVAFPAGHGYDTWFEDQLFLEPNHPPFVQLGTPTDIVAPTAEWQEQWAAYMSSALDGETPTLVDPTP